MLRKRWPGFLILLATFFLFRVKGLFSFLSSNQFAGRDLASNFAFTWLMKQNILAGEVFSWTNQWLLGFPSFEFYPPLFFFITAGADLVTGQLLGLDFWFKTLVFLSVFLIPLPTYYILKEPFSRIESFFAGFYMLYFLFVYPPVSQTYQVFSTGLVAQGFSFFLLMVSIGFMLRDGKRQKIIAGFFLASSVLSHPFVAVTGFTLSLSIFLVKRDLVELLPSIMAGIISAPLLVPAISASKFLDIYQFAPAETGLFLYILLPLIVIGGCRGEKSKALLATFLILLSISIFEIPFIAQELRFYTYALGIGSILSGFGAYRVLKYLVGETDIDYRVLGLLLLIPVVGLSLHADVSQSWELEEETEPLYDKLRELENGRVIVETSDSSLYSSFALQGMIPVETDQWVVNDVHLDSSTSASYILMLESWISESPVPNPICRSCDTSPGGLLDRRMDDLGVRYVVLRTPESNRSLGGGEMEYRGKYGDFWLFENREGYEIVEPLNQRPIVLEGDRDKWREVNDKIFAENISKDLVWVKKGSISDYSTAIDMEGMNITEIVGRIEEADVRDLEEGKYSYNLSDRHLSVKSSTPVKIKVSHFPHKNGYPASTFNTVFLPSGEKFRLTRDGSAQQPHETLP